MINFKKVLARLVGQNLIELWGNLVVESVFGIIWEWINLYIKNNPFVKESLLISV